MKNFVQYGAGNIGRGFIGALFSQAGYLVKFIDIDKQIINALNERKSYIVEIVSDNGSKETVINNVCGVDGFDKEAVTDAIANADIMATSVGVNVLPRILLNIAEGLKRRWQSGNFSPFNILICENLLDADKFMHQAISENLNDKEKEYFENCVGLIETSIGRMVPVMTEEMKKGDCLRVCVEKYCQLPVDKAAFKGDIPKINNIYPFTPFGYFIRRKLFIHNMGHAFCAYLGNILGCEYIWQAMDNPAVKLLALRAMTESAKTLSKHYNMPLDDLLLHIDDLLERFANKALGDTVQRVGRDLKRKLSASDRLAGAAKMCEEEGIEPVYICAGIACALLFDLEGDEGTKYVRDMISKEGIDYFLTEFCGFKEDSSKNYVKECYELMKKEANLYKLLAKCEDINGKILDKKNII